MNKHHKLIIAWFIISGLIVFTAVRQIQVAAASNVQAHKPLPPPAKTRHAIRPPILPSNGDPVADYVARCEKGMTDREIGWILEDFRNSGLDQFAFSERSTDDELLAYRVAQNGWYREALIDGLRLNREQSKEVMQKQREQFEKLKAAFKRNRAEDGTGIRPSFATSRFDLILSPFWLMGAEEYEIPDYSTFMPWDLCSLTPQQEQITWKKEYLAEEESDTAVTFPVHPRFKNAHPVDQSSGIFETWQIADAVFPFLKSQTFKPKETNADVSGQVMLENLRLIHPSQFKIILMIAPNLARELQSALDSGSH
ncbi:MAG: hypothetical protein ABIS50_22370 [Luteolibacter sp.]|uniref:hypothetical protein n=1 Tax=Luteolibacter sp. TaxID=1962973 RepID=UPI003264A731